MCLKRVFNPIPLSVPPPYILELRVSQAFPSCCVWVLTYYRKNKNMDSKKKHLFVLNLIHITNVHVIIQRKNLLKRHHLVLLLIRHVYLYKIGENQTLRGCNCLEFLISNLQQFIQSTLVPNCRRGSNMHQEENYLDFINYQGRITFRSTIGYKRVLKSTDDTNFPFGY